MHSFIVLSKLECLSQLRTLEIWNNEILKCKNLKSFVVYRFQYLTEFNQHKIDERDKKIAKMNFHIFDRLLSMDIISVPPSTSEPVPTQKGEKPSEDKNDMKQKLKKNSDYAIQFVDKLMNR